jgi:AraC-like DNA-binding protein
MSAGMVTAITPRLVAEECMRRGASRTELLDRAGITADCLRHPLGRIPVEKMFSLWESALQLTEDPMIGMHCAESVPFGTYGLLDYILAASATPREGLLRSSRAFGLMNNAFLLTLRLRRDVACIELHNPCDPRNLPRPYVEYIFVNYLVRLRNYTRLQWNPIEVHFTCGKPSHSHEYQRVFRGDVQFHESGNRMVFSKHLMEFHNPFADPELCELLENHAQRRLQGLRYDAPLLASLRLVLNEGLRSGNIDLPFVAKQLAMSPRCVQREILAQGTTFRQVLDDLRREHALRLVEELDLPVGEVASHLHFATTSSFIHAFRRWMGVSPQAYRRRLDNGQVPLVPAPRIGA